MTQEDMDTLAQLVDTLGLDGVVSALSAVCHDKAEHVLGNWQDEVLAAIWTKRARRLDWLRSRLY